MSEGQSFIHSTLDDYGLTPQQFRVYCAILRRGDCFESVPHMAVRCRLNRKTIVEVVRELLALGLISKTSRKGQSNVYHPEPAERWKPNPNKYPTQTNTQVFKRGRRWTK